VPPWAAGAFVGSVTGGMAMRALGRRVLLAGLIVEAAGLLALYAVLHGAGAGVTSLDLLVPMIVGGTGMGMVFVPLFDIDMPAVEPPEMGSASSVLQAVNALGISLRVAGLARSSSACSAPPRVPAADPHPQPAPSSPPAPRLAPDDRRGTEPAGAQPRPAGPVRLVAEYDNLILSHADRSRVISEAGRGKLYTRNGVFPGTVLVNGFASGTWRIDRAAGAATLTVEPFGKISGKDRAAVAGEGEQLLAFAAPGAAHDIRFAPVS
jgi:hypothetical protein